MQCLNAETLASHSITQALQALLCRLLSFAEFIQKHFLFQFNQSNFLNKGAHYQSLQKYSRIQSL